MEVPDICAERWHAAPREIACDSRPKFSKLFRGREILRSKSREIAPKSAVPHVLQPGHEPERSPDTVPSVGMPRHVRFGAILGEVLTEIFKKKNRGREILRSKSREIAPNFAPDVLQRLADRPRFVNCPQHHAAREIRCDFW